MCRKSLLEPASQPDSQPGQESDPGVEAHPIHDLFPTNDNPDLLRFLLGNSGFHPDSTSGQSNSHSSNSRESERDDYSAMYS
jgi:hypothetical protein